MIWDQEVILVDELGCSLYTTWIAQSTPGGNYILTANSSKFYSFSAFTYIMCTYLKQALYTYSFENWDDSWT